MSKIPFKMGKAKKEYTMPMAVLKGLIVSYMVTIPVFLIFALILSRIESCSGLISPVVLVTTIISVMVAGMVSARCLRSRGWANGALTGLSYMLVLYIIGSIIYMDFSVTQFTLTMTLIGILSGAVGGILGVNYKATYSR